MPVIIKIKSTNILSDWTFLELKVSKNVGSTA